MLESVREVEIWLRPGVQLLDVTGPVEVFASTTRYCRHFGIEGGYRLRLLADRRGTVTTAAGIPLIAEATGAVLDRQPAKTATLLIPSLLEEPDLPPDPRLDRRVARWPGRLASVCAGAWVLARAGRLDRRRATTHWLIAERMRQRFPKVDVDVDALWVRDGPVWTSAGVSAGIDLALAMVEADLGRAVAVEVARLLVLFMKRPGGQSQFSPVLEGQRHEDDVWGDLLRSIHERPDADLRVEALAQRMAMSPRHFARRFVDVMGKTPAQAVREIRIEVARRLLEQDADLGMDEVAARSGLGTAESLRRHFVQALGIPPGAYRDRFAP